MPSAPASPALQEGAGQARALRERPALGEGQLAVNEEMRFTEQKWSLLDALMQRA